jgi:PrtD family type I secretion system ABC transporter
MMSSVSPKNLSLQSLSARGNALAGILLEMRSAWVSVVVFSLVINILMLTQPVYSMNLFDRVMTSRNLVTLATISLIAVAFLAVMAAVEWVRTQIMVRISVRLDKVLGVRLLELAHQLQIEQSDGRGQGLLADLNTVRTFLTGHAIFPILDMPWVPIYFFVLLALHPNLALVSTVSAVILFIITYFTEEMTKGPLEQAQEKQGEAARFAALNMRNADVIEAMGMLKAMSSRWKAFQDAHIFAQAAASDRAGLLMAASKFVKTVAQSATMGAGAYLAVGGEISGGALMAAGMLSGRMMMPIEMFISSWAQWGNAIGSWKRLNDAVKTPAPVRSNIKLPAPKGELTLEGVKGGAPSIQTPFVNIPTLKIPSGASVAIIGASAAGKSSLLKLITGIWPPRDGTVRIDGADMKSWPRDELGPHLGYLPQDVSLIEGTIAENISRHGEIDSEKVIEAAKAAGVHDMILHMANGYSTPVGVNGTSLSGGQRQRVGLARALYGNPTLLVLDEPNANLDEAGEQALDSALLNAKKRGQTVLIASHRPSAIRHCDLVLVMQSGEVTLYGPRDQVLKTLAKAAGPQAGAPAIKGSPTQPAPSAPVANEGVPA